MERGSDFIYQALSGANILVEVGGEIEILDRRVERWVTIRSSVQ